MERSFRDFAGRCLGLASIGLHFASISFAQSMTGPESVQATLDGLFRYSVTLSSSPPGSTLAAVDYSSINTTVGLHADSFCQFGLFSSFPVPPTGGYGRLIEPTQEGTVSVTVYLCPFGSARITTRILPDPRAQFMHTGDAPVALAVADCDGDARLDVVTANLSSDNATVLLGDGDGIFRASASYPTGNDPRSVAAADFNGDSLPDLATANSSSGDVSVLLQMGSGGFGPAVAYRVGSAPRSVVAADFNGDGAPDLAAANFASLDVSVLLNTGVGEFRPAIPYRVGLFPSAVAAADLNRDGAPDLVTANLTSVDVSVLLGAGDGSFGAATAYPVGSRPDGIALADLEANGTLDVVTVSASSDNVSVLLGNGDGSLGAPSNFSVSGRDPAAIALADLDGDEIVDIATANSFGNNVSVRPGNGDGTFKPSVRLFEVGLNPQSIALADMDGNSVPDIVTASSRSDSVSVVANPFDWTISVAIDIKPGSDVNRINQSGLGRIPVALLGSDVLDIADVDPATLSFGPEQASPVHDLTDPTTLAEHIDDVNGDGLADLVSHYEIQQTGLSLGDTEACLRGRLFNERRFEGCDSVLVFSKRGGPRSNR